MKIMAVAGSPRRGGNTELLVDRVIAGCRSASKAEVEKIMVTEADISMIDLGVALATTRGMR